MWRHDRHIRIPHWRIWHCYKDHRPIRLGGTENKRAQPETPEVTSRFDVRKYFFSQRVVNLWNNLQKEVVEAPSMDSFKSKLDKAWNSRDTLYTPTRSFEQSLHNSHAGLKSLRTTLLSHASTPWNYLSTFCDRKCQDYVYIKWEYRSTMQKIKHY